MDESNQPPSQIATSNSRNINDKIQSPWQLLSSVNKQQKITFIAAFLGWTLDAFDFFTVILSVPYIAKEFQMEPSDITAR